MSLAVVILVHIYSTTKSLAVVILLHIYSTTESLAVVILHIYTLDVSIFSKDIVRLYHDNLATTIIIIHMFCVAHFEIAQRDATGLS